MFEPDSHACRREFRRYPESYWNFLLRGEAVTSFFASFLAIQKRRRLVLRKKYKLLFFLVEAVEFPKMDDQINHKCRRDQCNK